ncbi:unnamed protein product [Rangifer tarandus platyrhynchus]|uniref:Uncharacterized protein n=1 Tax=Rangifer tarandus platyrhynchus TaxID=3082113 RepID=A0AC59YAZ4_RANTA
MGPRAPWPLRSVRVLPATQALRALPVRAVLASRTLPALCRALLQAVPAPPPLPARGRSSVGPLSPQALHPMRVDTRNPHPAMLQRKAGANNAPSGRKQQLRPGCPRRGPASCLQGRWGGGSTQQRPWPPSRRAARGASRSSRLPPPSTPLS